MKTISAPSIPFARLAEFPLLCSKKILIRGVMHACVHHDVDIVLTGAIRDEGPIPG